VLDTGTGLGAGGHVALVPAHGSVSVTVAGAGGVPSAGAASAALNVAVISTTAGGFLTAYAADQARPAAASVDFAAGSTTATLTTIGLSSGGAVTFFNGSSAGIRVVANVFGYYRSGAAAVPGSFVQVAPTNLYDSAVDGGNLPAYGTVDPAAVSSPTRAAAWTDGRSALVLAVAVVDAPASGFLTAFSAEKPRPAAANLDFAAGQLTLNGAVVQLSEPNSDIDLFNGSSGAIRAVVNLFGYYLDGPGSAETCAGFSNTTGISNSTITLANASDLSGPVPGLYLPAQQATEAYAAYFNSVSSICGRSLSVEALDSQTNSIGDQEAATTACASAFAMVGSMASYDDGGAPVAAQCGIPDIRTQPSSVVRQNAAGTYAAGYGDLSQIPAVVPQYFVQTAPTAAANAAYLYMDYAPISAEAQTEIAGWTQEGFHFLYTNAVPVTTGNFAPYVSHMQQLGVKYVQFRGPYQYAIRLAQAMQQQGFTPLFVTDPSTYNPGYLTSGGAAVNGTLIFDNAALFEESASNPEMQLYEHWLQVVAPGATPTYLGLYAWSAGRLFTDEALTLGGKLTRASMLAALASVHAWTGRGLFSPEDVGNKTTSGCAAIIQLANGVWTRQSPGTYLCGPILK
jgi:ABC-type branched-subunit amino acid transport system substrate-binding protein